MSDHLDDGAIIKFMFFFDTTNEIIHIRYMKIQEAIANIGGFMKVLIIILGIFMIRYQKIDLMSDLI
jgi:hypothetical protein